MLYKCDTAMSCLLQVECFTDTQNWVRDSSREYMKTTRVEGGMYTQT